MPLEYLEPNQIEATDGQGWPARKAIADESLVARRAGGDIASWTPGNGAYLVTNATGKLTALSPGADRVMITDLLGTPAGLNLPDEAIVAGGASGLGITTVVINASELAGRAATGSIQSLSDDELRTILDFPIHDSLFEGDLYAANLTATTSLTNDTTYFVYGGRTSEALTASDIVCRVTTAWVNFGAGRWAEVGVFTGAFVPNGNASLTRRGSTNVQSTFNSTGIKKTNVSLSGVSVGDDVWIAFGSKSNTNYQLRGVLADDIQSGVFQRAAGRLSTLASPVSTTIESATKVPAWIRLAA